MSGILQLHHLFLSQHVAWSNNTLPTCQSFQENDHKNNSQMQLNLCGLLEAYLSRHL